jgi:DNA-binding CsgD family transcriptional regulator
MIEAPDRLAGSTDFPPDVVPDGGPVLIFEVDAASIGDASAPARRCEVRLIGSVRGVRGGERRLPGHAELSAVLILRALTPARLLSSVRELTSTGTTLGPPAPIARRGAVGHALPAAPAEGVPPVAQLEPRELAVLRRLAEGDSTRDIALRLSYSERTVKTIVRDTLDKLDCRTRAHAVALAARRGLV